MSNGRSWRGPAAIVAVLLLVPALAMPQAQSVVSLALIDADTGQVIPGHETLADGATLNLATLPTRRLNIRATTSPPTVGSVRFGYDAKSAYRTENNPPYSLAGDDGGRYNAWTPTVGSHTVTATPYTGANASGTPGIPLTRTFTVTDQAGPAVTTFSLVDGRTGQAIPGHAPLPSTIDLAALPTRTLDIRANTSPAVVGSVRFGYDGDPAYRVENGAPYLLAGGTGGWTPAVGSHTVSATPYTGAGATGTAGAPLTQWFTVVDGGGDDDPPPPPPGGGTTVQIVGSRFFLNGQVTHPGFPAEGRLMNVRMVNAVFEDTNRPSFDPEANTDEFLAVLPDYVAAGVRAFTISLQGGNPSYLGAVNTAFTATGALKPAYMARVERVIRAADAAGAVVILALFYQKQDERLADEQAVRAGVVNAVRWIVDRGFRNVLVEITNEYPHTDYDHPVLNTPEGVASLIALARQTAPGLYYSASGYGKGFLDAAVAAASDFLLIHMNSVTLPYYDDRIRALTGYGKPIVINEDDKYRDEGVLVMEAALQHGASWGVMYRTNQAYPFTFRGTRDDPIVYDAIRRVTGSD